MILFLAGLTVGILLGASGMLRLVERRQRDDLEIGAILRANALRCDAEAKANSRKYGIIIEPIEFELTGRSLS